MPLFLALTADERFWDPSRKTLFLGEWCRLFSRRDRWQKIDHEVLPYPWDDRARLRKDYEDLRGCYARTLGKLSARLEEIHREKHSDRFWKTVLGPWCYHFVQIAFDRYLCLSAALARPEIDETIIPEAGANAAPWDYQEFLETSSSDADNQILYGQILEMMAGVKAGATLNLRRAPLSSDRPATPKMTGGWRAFLRRVLYRLTLAAARHNRIVMIAPYFPFKMNLRLHWRLGQVPVAGDYEMPRPSPSSPEPAWRRPLPLSGGENDFEKILAQIAPLHMPMSYVEDFKARKADVLRRYPDKPQTIVTANNLVSDDNFKIWSACRQEDGSRIVGLQHGGHYGMGAWNSEEEHEVAVSDRFYSWGWRAAGADNVVPFLGTKLAPRSLPSQPQGGILLALMTLPRYSYWMYSVPAGPQHLSYIDDQIAFLKALSPEAFSLMSVRPYSKDWGWGQNERIKEAHPGVALSGGGSFYEELAESRLFVCTYNSTTYLETFAMNYPTVCFWNPRHWELRPSAAPAFEALAAAGIYHQTPEAAAAHVDKIRGDVAGWWRSSAVQRAREAFCRSFARTSGRWLDEWAAEFEALSAGAARGVSR